MDRKTLRKLQLTQLDMLKKIDAVCKRHGIHYWLDSGTLLGAVRHKGFIPWDDDLDVAMLRNDYEQFLKYAPAELGETFFLQNWHSDESFGYPFSKLIKKNTRYKIFLQRNVSAWDGIFVDIFPFDVFPKTKLQRFFHKFSVVIPKGIIKIKCGYDMSTNRTLKQKIRSWPFLFIAKFCSREQMIRKYEKNIQKYNGTHTGFCFGCNATDYGKYVIQEKWIGNLTLRQFEDGMYPCPDDSESWLTAAYGDYMKLPPIGEREQGHDVIEISFDTTAENL